MGDMEFPEFPKRCCHRRLWEQRCVGLEETTTESTGQSLDESDRGCAETPSDTWARSLWGHMHFYQSLGSVQFLRTLSTAPRRQLDRNQEREYSFPIANRWVICNVSVPMNHRFPLFIRASNSSLRNSREAVLRCPLAPLPPSPPAEPQRPRNS